MKKMLFGLSLMLASAAASASTISISNYKTDGFFDFVDIIGNTETYQEYKFSANSSWGNSLSGPVNVWWDLQSDVDANFNIKMDASPDTNGVFGSSWEVSVLNSANEALFSGGLGQVGNVDINAGETLKAVISGNLSDIVQLFTNAYSSKFWCKKNCGHTHPSNGLSAFNASIHLSDITKVEAPDVSEIPLPAAVWLFGSALLGGAAIRRKRKADIHSQVA